MLTNDNNNNSAITWTSRVFQLFSLRFDAAAVYEKLVLVLVDLFFLEQDLGAYSKRKWQLVAFKQRAADVLVNGVGVVFVHVGQSLAKVFGHVALFDRVSEQTDVGI